MQFALVGSGLLQFALAVIAHYHIWPKQKISAPVYPY